MFGIYVDGVFVLGIVGICSGLVVGSLLKSVCEICIGDVMLGLSFKFKVIVLLVGLICECLLF